MSHISVRDSMTHQWMMRDRFVIEEDRDCWRLGSDDHPLREMRRKREMCAIQRPMHARLIHVPISVLLEEDRESWAQQRDAMIASGKGLA